MQGHLAFAPVAASSSNNLPLQDNMNSNISMAVNFNGDDSEADLTEWLHHRKIIQMVRIPSL